MNVNVPISDRSFQIVMAVFIFFLGYIANMWRMSDRVTRAEVEQMISDRRGIHEIQQGALSGNLQDLKQQMTNMSAEVKTMGIAVGKMEVSLLNLQIQQNALENKLDNRKGIER